jgi:hypothetical protein
MNEPSVLELKGKKKNEKQRENKYSSITLTYYKNLAIVLGSPVPLYLLVSVILRPALPNYSWVLDMAAVFVWVAYALTVYFWALAQVYGLLVLLRHNNLDRGENERKIIFTKTFQIITQVLGIGILVVLTNSEIALLSGLLGLLIVLTQALSFRYVPKLAVSLYEGSK